MNPREHGGVRRVSIHAPAWGATSLSAVGPGLTLVSIHAPAWGATHGDKLTLMLFGVSIHAPAWGATVLHADWQIGLLLLFQSTPPHGERPDGVWLSTSLVDDAFQSTPPHGERRGDYLAVLSRHARSFNPRPRMGSDSMVNVGD